MPEARSKTNPQPSWHRSPTTIPADILEAATAMYLGSRRLDMGRLAVDLGIGRATLYRRVGSRDQVLGEVLWSLGREVLAQARDAHLEARGVKRVVATVEATIVAVQGWCPLQRLLENEPEVALRVLSTKHGPVHGRIVTGLSRLLDEEAERSGMRLSIAHDSLAYAIVRICESFMYSDVIAGVEPDVGRAIEIITALLDGARLSGTPSDARHAARPATDPA